MQVSTPTFPQKQFLTIAPSHQQQQEPQPHQMEKQPQQLQILRIGRHPPTNLISLLHFLRCLHYSHQASLKPHRQVLKSQILSQSLNQIKVRLHRP
jgi:hypothetical protein